MTLLLTVVGIALFVHGAYQLFKYLVVTSNLKPIIPLRNTREAYHPRHKITILAPVLHEEKTIENFLQDLADQKYHKNLYDIYVVTTQVEYNIPSSPNTIDIIERIISENRLEDTSLKHIHYPSNGGLKSDQLNFAIQEIRSRIGDVAFEDLYFLLLDADSKVDDCTLERFDSAIENGVEIYQQPLIWFKNLKTLTSSFMQSFAFLQTFFSLSYEMPMYTGRFYPWRLKYFVGHGLCVKGSFLLKIVGFPSIIEDVRIGRLSSFLNVKTKLVDGFGIVETAKSLSVYMKQSSVWFFGCGLFLSDYVFARTLRGTKKFWAMDIPLIAYGFFKAFRWLNKGPLHLIGIIGALWLHSWFLFVLFLVSLTLNSSMSVWVVSHTFKDLLLKDLPKRDFFEIVLKALFCSPILYIINFVGVYHGLLKMLKFYTWGTVTLPKTER